MCAGNYTGSDYFRRLFHEIIPAEDASYLPGILPNTMTKQQITDHYSAATKSGKDAITAAAREHLRSRGIVVTRQALKLWRESKFNESKLHGFYLKAYTVAITRLAAKPAVQP